MKNVMMCKSSVESQRPPTFIQLLLTAKVHLESPSPTSEQFFSQTKNG